MNCKIGIDVPQIDTYPGYWILHKNCLQKIQNSIFLFNIHNPSLQMRISDFNNTCQYKIATVNLNNFNIPPISFFDKTTAIIDFQNLFTDEIMANIVKPCLVTRIQNKTQILETSTQLCQRLSFTKYDLLQHKLSTELRFFLNSNELTDIRIFIEDPFLCLPSQSKINIRRLLFEMVLNHTFFAFSRDFNYKPTKIQNLCAPDKQNINQLSLSFPNQIEIVFMCVEARQVAIFEQLMQLCYQVDFQQEFYNCFSVDAGSNIAFIDLVNLPTNDSQLSIDNKITFDEIQKIKILCQQHYISCGGLQLQHEISMFYNEDTAIYWQTPKNLTYMMEEVNNSGEYQQYQCFDNYRRVLQTFSKQLVQEQQKHKIQAKITLPCKFNRIPFVVIPQQLINYINHISHMTCQINPPTSYRDFNLLQFKNKPLKILSITNNSITYVEYAFMLPKTNSIFDFLQCFHEEELITDNNMLSDLQIVKNHLHSKVITQWYQKQKDQDVVVYIFDNNNQINQIGQNTADIQKQINKVISDILQKLGRDANVHTTLFEIQPVHATNSLQLIVMLANIHSFMKDLLNSQQQSVLNTVLQQQKSDMLLYILAKALHILKQSKLRKQMLDTYVQQLSKGKFSLEDAIQIYTNIVQQEDKTLILE